MCTFIIILLAIILLLNNTKSIIYTHKKFKVSYYDYPTSLTDNFMNEYFRKIDLIEKNLEQLKKLNPNVKDIIPQGQTIKLPKETLESIEVFHQALDLYLKKDFINAGKLFLTAQKLYTEDETPSIFIDRCKQFYKNGVPEDWDGVINMTSK